MSVTRRFFETEFPVLALNTIPIHRIVMRRHRGFTLDKL